MEDALICPRCSWIHVDGGGDFCNGCGARHARSGPAVAVMQRDVQIRPIDLVVLCGLLMTLLGVIVTAAV
jgi:hypothetical protein